MTLPPLPCLDRRRWLALAAAGACGSGRAAEPAGESVELPGIQGRVLQVTVLAPATPRGVVLFSHGLGAEPAAYPRLHDALRAAGYGVLAPLHVDSQRHPLRERYPMPATFGERVADLKATAALAEARWPGLPVAAVGHSYGALLSCSLGGALAYAGNFRVPAVKTVVAFSSPGVIPGLVNRERAYATLQVPVLTLTGDADLVPGFVSDWQDHLLALRTAPAGLAWALSFAGARHDLVRDAGAAGTQARAAALAFLEAGLSGRGDLRERLQAVAPDAQLSAR